MEEYERITTEASSPPSAKEIRENYPDQYLQRYLNQARVQPLEGPSVLQLGGSDPKQLYEAAQTVMDMVSFSDTIQRHFLVFLYRNAAMHLD